MSISEFFTIFSLGFKSAALFYNNVTTNTKNTATNYIYMISSGDKEYIHSKRIKKGEEQLISPYAELADWIQERFEVKPLNIVYDILEHNKQPRLQVIFELNSDKLKFSSSNQLFPNKNKQEEIAEKFKALIDNYPKYSAGDIYVIFGAFEPIAKEEANGKIGNEVLKSLKNDLNDPDLWAINKNFYTGIFFFYKNHQVKIKEVDGTEEKFKDAYFEIIKKNDEFNYLKKQDFSIKFDSKENFDQIYQSNWFYYFKDN